MKKILSIIIIGAAFYAAADTTNSITVKFTVETLGVATNSTTLKLDGVAGSKRDKFHVAGQTWKYEEYINSGTGTNTMDVWLKERFKAQVDYEAIQRVRAEQLTLMIKLSTLINEQPELLSDADRVTLAAIAAKLP